MIADTHPTQPNLTPGAVHNLIPDPNLTTPIGNLVTIEATHRTGPQQWVTVSAPVLADKDEVQPGERRLRLETWTVAADRIGRLVQDPPTPAQLEAILRILDADDEPAASCPKYDWCLERGDHDAHQGATVELASPSAWPGDGPYLGAYLLDFGGGPIAGLDAGTWLDFDSAGLRAEAVKVRAHSDRLEQLADQLAAIETQATT